MKFFEAGCKAGREASYRAVAERLTALRGCEGQVESIGARLLLFSAHEKFMDSIC